MNDPDAEHHDEHPASAPAGAPPPGGREGDAERGDEPQCADTARRERLLHAVSTPLGSLCLVGGLVMIPLPGPSLPLLILGLGLLAREYGWARALLKAARRRLPGGRRGDVRREGAFEVPARIGDSS